MEQLVEVSQQAPHFLKGVRDVLIVVNIGYWVQLAKVKHSDEFAGAMYITIIS